MKWFLVGALSGAILSLIKLVSNNDLTAVRFPIRGIVFVIITGGAYGAVLYGTLLWIIFYIFG
jgi:hypothetical protein